MVRISDQGPRLSAKEIDELEARIGFGLPDDYRQFLLGNNGGAPAPDTVDIGGLPGTPTDLQVFFGIGRPIESSNIEWNIQMFAERIGSNRLPIAGDSGGSVYCLSLSDRDNGSVYYLDFEDGSNYLYHVAPDFKTFLERIRSFES